MTHRPTAAAGAALLATALCSVAAAGSLPPLTHTTVDGVFFLFTGNGGNEFNTSYSAGPGLGTSYFSGTNFTGSSVASVTGLAYHDAGSDLLKLTYTTGATGLLPNGLTHVSINWSVNFTTDMRVTVMTSDLTGFWMDGSTPITPGQVFAAGSGALGWFLPTPTTPSDQTSYVFTIGFAPAAAGAVPLPGAAGLAAVGLVGMARRRRR